MAEKMAFDDLIESIQNAFIRVNAMSEEQHLNKLAEYFEDDGTPKTFDMQYPYFDENGIPAYRVVSIPQICLVPISSLKLDEIEIDFKMALCGEVPLEEVETEEPEQGSLFKRKFGAKPILGHMPQERTMKNKDDNYANIKLKFSSQDPPEGLMRIRDQFIRVTI